jgi:hypothetical protein
VEKSKKSPATMHSNVVLFLGLSAFWGRGEITTENFLARGLASEQFAGASGLT